MKTHYSEADLLETWYTQPGESMPVMMHLADCDACAARYERLEAKLRALAACEHERPETFWAHQRHAVMRRVAERPARPAFFARAVRMAAAAALALVVGGVMTWKLDHVRSVPAVETASAAVPAPAASGETALSTDPWQSDALREYQSIVAWESWVETPGAGDQSL